MISNTEKKECVIDTRQTGLPPEKKLVLEMWCTLTCNENCIMCPTRTDSKELISKNRFVSLAQKYLRMGVKQINFQGGEPTLINDLDDYCDYAKRIGYAKVKLDTNGVLLADRNLVQRLKKSGLGECLVSLHSTDRKTSETITGRSRAFHRTVAGLHRLAQYGIPFTISFVISKLNYQEIPDFILYCHNTFDGVDFSIACSFPIPIHKAWENRKMAIPVYSDVTPFLEKGLAIGKELNMNIVIPGLSSMPLCVFPSYHHYPESFDIFSPVVVDEINAGVELPVDVREKKLVGGYRRIHTTVCESCSLKASCQGIHKNYLRIHGDSEIIPAP